MLTFVARPYLIPSESMEPTLHGCRGCTGDRIMVDKITYRFGSPQPGDVIVFKGPPNWNIGYKSIRSPNTAVRWVQNTLSFVGFVPPDENDLVKRVIATGGQTVECRADYRVSQWTARSSTSRFWTPTTMMADPAIYPCLGNEFGPVKVPDGRLWVMGDNRTALGRFARALRQYAGRRSAQDCCARVTRRRGTGADRQCHWKGAVHRLAAVALGWTRPRGEPAGQVDEPQ